jgi:universal stress protein E
MVATTSHSKHVASFRRILVAVKDVERKSLPAVLKAAQLARACGADIELFHSLSTPVYIDLYAFDAQGFEDVEQKLQQQALRRLEEIANRIRKHNIRVTVSAQWDFPVYEAVVRRALKINADLVVAEAHAGGHTVPWILRLTDWELVRLCPVPVLLVKNPRAYRHAAVLVAIDPTHANAKPLRLDKDILRSGEVLSEALRGTLHAVHAYARIPFGALPPFVVTPGATAAVERQSERMARKSVESVAGIARVARSRRYLIGSPPIDAIREAARKSRSAIVVMGAISRSGLKRLLIGNTAERILDDLSCDIMVVKPRGFHSRVPRASRGARLAMTAPAGSLGYY